MTARRGYRLLLALGIGCALAVSGSAGEGEARAGGASAGEASAARGVEVAARGPVRVAEAKHKASKSRAKKPSKAKKRVSKRRARKKRVRKKKVCTRRKGKRRCRWIPEFSGHGVAASRLRAEPLPRPSGELWVYAVNFREEVKVNIYDDRGALDEAALAKLDVEFRCKRTDQHRAVDPRLYEALSIIYDHFGKQRMELVSGFRNQDNEGSRHFHASAADFRIPGVSTRALYEFAKTLDLGGMGIGLYPTSGFIHLDYRAPGEKSYYWTDYSGPGGGKKKRKQRKRRRPSRNSQPNT